MVAQAHSPAGARTVLLEHYGITVRTNVASPASPATPATLTSPPVIPECFTCKEAFKAAGHMKRQEPCTSSRKIAVRVHATVPHCDTPLDKNAMDKAAKAVAAGEQLSPIKRGRIPFCPPKLADLLVEVLLVARKSGMRTGRSCTKCCAAVSLQGHPAEEHFVLEDGTTLRTGGSTASSAPARRSSTG